VNDVPMILWDQDETPASRDFISAFSGSRYFKVAGFAHSYAEVERAIDSGEALVALVVPRDFGGRIESGAGAPVQFILDGSDSNTASIAIGYAEAVASGWSGRVRVLQIRRSGGRVPAAPVDLRPRVWFNTEMESRNYIIPGLIAVIMMIIAALLTSLTVAREWERGTMEQLISTPVRTTELILGKLIPYFAIGLFDVLLIVLVGQFVFHVPLRGSVALLFAMAAVFLTGALSIGMLVSVFTRSQLLANQLSIIITFVPSYLLSGFMFSVDNMPVPLRVISRCIPATHFISIMKGIYLKGIGLEILGVEAALLTLFAVVTIAAANLRFRKKLE
jgi:ABC-2 type transport system permease protein